MDDGYGVAPLTERRIGCRLLPSRRDAILPPVHRVSLLKGINSVPSTPLRPNRTKRRLQPACANGLTDVPVAAERTG